jgi:hypothetical protein
MLPQPLASTAPIQHGMAESNFSAAVWMTMPSVVRDYLRWLELAKYKQSIDPPVAKRSSPSSQASSTMAQFLAGFDLDGLLAAQFCCRTRIGAPIDSPIDRMWSHRFRPLHQAQETIHRFCAPGSSV